jgi:hypothetical protein
MKAQQQSGLKVFVTMALTQRIHSIPPSIKTAPMLFTARFLILSSVVFVLAGCESSRRLGSLLPGANAASQPAPPPLTAAPSGDVDTTVLPPPNAPQQGALPGQIPQQPGSTVTAPGNLPATGSQQQVASLPATPAAPTRTGVTGNWGLVEAAGTRCRLTLSSAPKLDLYGAGTTGCQAKELQRINAWELSGSEVILYEPGGEVAARLRQAGSGFSGVSTKTGAPITISK